VPWLTFSGPWFPVASNADHSHCTGAATRRLTPTHFLTRRTLNADWTVFQATLAGYVPDEGVLMRVAERASTSERLRPLFPVDRR